MQKPSPDLIARARILLANTKRLRFFRGQVYDGGADEYLMQLHGVLDDLILLAAEESLSAASNGESLT
jgi:hypothetical protein